MTKARSWLAARRPTTAVLMVLVGGVLVFAGHASSAGSSVVTGVAIVTDPMSIDPGHPFTPGTYGPTQNFGLAVPIETFGTPPDPTAASCPGDSANAGFRVESFLIPASVDPTTLHFFGGQPQVNGANVGANLIQSGPNAPYVLEDTAPANGGTPYGQIFQPIPPFSMSRYLNARSSLFPTGNYLMGIACADTNENLTNFWDTPVSINREANNGVGTYTIPNPPASTPEVPLPLLLPLGAVALLGSGVWAQRRRSKSATPAVPA